MVSSMLGFLRAGHNERRQRRETRRCSFAAPAWPTGIVVLAVFTSLALIACGGDDGASGSPAPKKDAGGSDTSTDVATDVGKDTGEPDTGPTACEPKTCAQIGANCGSAPDGCGGKIECGECPDGQFCGG
ncbi:MAG: hypothetical protein CVU63_16945, partial [Deltaproteobacteria bacterium HGW-Deltaproteobacteria-20]